MQDIKNEYKSFLDDIEKNIKNKEDLIYIKERFASFLEVVLEEMDSLADYRRSEVDEMARKQAEIESKLMKMEDTVGNLVKEIYDEEGFDFEIVCPYCNYEFIVDIDETKKEIECPECKNMIELDWSGDNEETEEYNQNFNFYDEDDDM